jgi:two-component system NtrC family response regulator
MDKGKILIIDDEEQLRSLLTRIVSLEGFTVQEVAAYRRGRDTWKEIKLT